MSISLFVTSLTIFAVLRLLRSVDFDSCHQPVQLLKSSHGNFSHVYRSQFKSAQERSAVSTYLLRQREDGSAFDIKGAIQLGDQFTKPFGQETGRLVAKSNQVSLYYHAFILILVYYTILLTV